MRSQEIWKETLDSFNIIRDAISWLVGNVYSVWVDMDLWVGCNGSFILPRVLRVFLATRGNYNLNQISNEATTSLWF